MITLPGLARFSRSMTTRYAGTCSFCAQATRQGVDFAAVNPSGKWIAVCATCATSITAQVRALVLRCEASTATISAEQVAALTATLPGTANLSAALTPNAPEALAYDVLVRLQATLALAESFSTPVAAETPLLAGLQAVAANAAASPRDREFAASLASGLVKYGKLTERQQPHADRLVAKYAAGAPTASATSTVTEPGVYVVGNDHYLVKRAKAGHLYAMVRTSTIAPGVKITWEFVRGAMGTVATGHKITADEAAAIGHASHHCVFCSKALDDPRSTAVGYGPVCGPRNNLPWG